MGAGTHLSRALAHSMALPRPTGAAASASGRAACAGACVVCNLLDTRTAPEPYHVVRVRARGAPDRKAPHP